MQVATRAIFESTGQAIHVAFLVMGQPAQQDSMLRKALVRMLEAMDLPLGQHRDWLEQLRGTPSETIDFSGLSSYEVRAQCALIMLAVRTRLPAPEMWALQAKYGNTDCEVLGERTRYAFAAEKAAAIKGLSAWMRKSIDGVSADAMDCMVAKFYARQIGEEISFRGLAQSFGGNHMSYARAFPKVKGLLRPLEDMAVSRLHPYFVAQGIVGGQL